ncbi:MAG TPA: hypothetical protein VGD91_07600 [Trebonia sp.]
MSRTDAHAPFHVRIARGDVTADPCHAALHVTCDLPPLEATAPYGWRTTRCFWAFSYTGSGECPCVSCHGGALARAANRAGRRRDRAALTGARNAWRGGDRAAFDALVPPGRR